MEALLAHFVGDYFLQSHWMAVNKGKKLWIAAYHAFWYTVPFLFLTQNWLPLLIIWGTHAIIDRYKPVPYLAYIKNTLPLLLPFWTWSGWGWEEIIDDIDVNTGYPKDTPPWLSTWLNIILDNVLHIVINYLALKYL